MNKKNPFLSIITPILNDKDGLTTTIESIRKQKFKDFEYIVIDGGSKDGTLELIKESKIIDRWISETDKGLWDAINKGIKLSKGKIINTLNAGDEYYSENSLTIVQKNLINKTYLFCLEL